MTGTRARFAVLSGIVLVAFAATTAVGAVLTDDAARRPLTFADVLVTGAIPVLLLVAVTVYSRIHAAGGAAERNAAGTTKTTRPGPRTIR